jgi:hypothetical protein
MKGRQGKMRARTRIWVLLLAGMAVGNSHEYGGAPVGVSRSVSAWELSLHEVPK